MPSSTIAPWERRVQPPAVEHWNGFHTLGGMTTVTLGKAQFAIPTRYLDNGEYISLRMGEAEACRRFGRHLYDHKTRYGIVPDTFMGTLYSTTTLRRDVITVIRDGFLERKEQQLAVTQRFKEIRQRMQKLKDPINRGLWV